MKTITAALLLALAGGVPGSALAWGDEGHEVVALIAQHYLDPSAGQQVETLLAGDTSRLVPTDIAHEAVWADRYRDSDRNKGKQRYTQTRQWHYVDLELDGPDLDAACNQHPALPEGTAASAGTPDDCIVDKIEQFSTELASPATPVDERRLALEFVLHFVGDLHQPLHAADDHDKGGNDKIAASLGILSGPLHSYWDSKFVRELGGNDQALAAALIARITPEQIAQWTRGGPRDWALESYQVAKTEVYGKLPPLTNGDRYVLDAAYVANACQVTAVQLSKAGVRLAGILNWALGEKRPAVAEPPNKGGQ